MKSFKIVVMFFLVAFVSMNLLTGFCLAMQDHSCCPTEKTAKCPMQSMQKAASPKAVKAVKGPVIKAKPVPATEKSKPAAPAVHKQTEVPEFIPPNYYLSATIAHQTNAPPQA